MKLVLHIGMGKTGTSAVQKALAGAGDMLKAQRAAYLGMDFDLPGHDGPGWQKRAELFASAPDELARAGARVAAALTRRAAEDGTEVFLLSNESLTGQAKAMAPFLAPIRAAMAVEALAWARNPAGWLPSAYAQWGIRDKTFPGQVPAYPVAAGRLIGHYRGLLEWFTLLPGLVRLLPYRRDGDIVAEFAAATGLTLPPTPGRFYERREPAEQILRARFASAYPGRSRPDAFDRVVLRPRDVPPPLAKMVSQYLDYGATAEVVGRHAELFDQIAAQGGVDLRTIPEDPPERPEVPRIRNRLIDLLVEVGMQQARRISALEARLATLEARAGIAAPAEAPGDAPGDEDG